MRTGKTLSFSAAIVIAGLADARASAAQGLAVANLELPRESPVGKISQQVGLTEIAVEHGSPAVAGRKIWGALVPFDKLWSLGAYQATKVRFSRDVTFGDNAVPAGTYALFALPGKASWAPPPSTRSSWGSRRATPCSRSRRSARRSPAGAARASPPAERH
jgi:hypothetical protein